MLCPEQQLKSLLGCVPVERFAWAVVELVGDGVQGQILGVVATRVMP